MKSLTPAKARKNGNIKTADAQPSERRKGGRPMWVPTKEEREQIELYTSMGYTQEQISGLIGKSVDVLAKHCRTELDNGMLKVNGQVGGKLYQKCMAGDTTALIFWAKTRMGWKEPVERVELHMTLEALVMQVVEMRKGQTIDGTAKQITKE